MSESGVLSGAGQNMLPAGAGPTQPQQVPGAPPPNYQIPQQFPAAAYAANAQYAQQYAAHYVAAQPAPQSDQLRAFWQSQIIEVEQVGNDPAEFKNHQLPLARIKKIMKSDEDVRMISAEAPVLFAKACEMFILELTLRSWIHAEENKRRTLQRNDIAAAITKTDIFDFLVDIVPREELKPEGAPEAPRPPQMQPPMQGMYYPYGMPPQAVQGGDPSMLGPRPSLPMDPSLVYQQQGMYMGMPGQQWAPQPVGPGTMPTPGGASVAPPTDSSNQQ